MVWKEGVSLKNVLLIVYAFMGKQLEVLQRVCGIRPFPGVR